MNTTLRAVATTLWLTLFLSGASALPCFGHNENVHREITGKAFESSDGVNGFLSDYLGSQHAPFKFQPFLKAEPSPLEGNYWGYTPYGWLVEGSYYEDETFYGSLGLRKEWRCLDHFYVPWPAPHGLTDPSDGLFGKKLPSQIVNSFTWATTPGIAGISGVPFVESFANNETWPDARDYQYEALTQANKADREENLAHMLYALGHVLHLNQDTSSPDHTRNDSHKNKAYFEDHGHDHFRDHLDTWFALPPLNRRGSAYWRGAGFSKLEDFWDKHQYMGNASALNSDANGGAKLGLAEFSNGNFLGEDALYGETITLSDKDYATHHFPLPSLYSSTRYSEWARPLGASVGATFLRDGTIVNRDFLEKVTDGVRVQRHSAVSYLGTRGRNRVPLVSVTIKDPTVLDEYHSILVPKAIEYSAGLLDYFFRGQITVSSSWDIANQRYDLTILNGSGQGFSGGTFTLVKEEANGTRSPAAGFVANYPGSLADGSSVVATLSGSTSELTKHILIYRGSIGTTDTVDQDLAIAARQLTLISTESPLPDATVGVSYSVPLQAEGVAPLQWSIAAGTLPAGVSLSATSGAISGTPTSDGTFNFTVQVQGAAGNSATCQKAFQMVVQEVQEPFDCEDNPSLITAAEWSVVRNSASGTGSVSFAGGGGSFNLSVASSGSEQWTVGTSICNPTDQEAVISFQFDAQLTVSGTSGSGVGTIFSPSPDVSSADFTYQLTPSGVFTIPARSIGVISFVFLVTSYGSPNVSLVGTCDLEQP